jgi:cation diffusion facilitator CzcD-associated flavoprotein CzcO
VVFSGRRGRDAPSACTTADAHREADVTITEDESTGIEAVRARYAAEREKRLRADGNEQYVEIAGQFAHYLEDPYVEVTPREPLFDEVTVALIGGGFAGLVAGAHLVRAGVTDVRIIEKGGDVGGTWYWNRYPGAQCDIESYVYLPLLEETGYVPTEKYAYAPEIHAHCRRIATHFGLYENACFSTEVQAVDWDEASSRWVISTNRGDRMRAKFIVMGNGPLHRPKLPGIPGIESYTGHSFHTSRWDYDYTGGDASGGLHKLADKRVGIIGTGATAVQCVPHLARAAKALYVFQRTPSSIDVRGNRPTDPGWAASLEPGWQQHRVENFTSMTSGSIAPEDLVMDGWTDIARRVVTKLQESSHLDLSMEGILKALEASDFEKMDEIRARVDAIVDDPATAEALKPWYRQLCKRPCFHDEYLASFNLPGVRLVDTDGKGVDRITETSVVVAGKEYEVDCLIYATGFEVGTEYTRRAGFDLSGRDGRTLSAYWDDGPRTLHGMHVNGFPNAFVVSHVQGAFTASYPHLLEETSKQIAYLVAKAEAEGIGEIEAAADAEEAWVQSIVQNGRMMGGLGATDCTPGYYNNEGQPSPLAAHFASYGGGPLAFFQMMESWRAAGDCQGLELRPTS